MNYFQDFISALAASFWI